MNHIMIDLESWGTRPGCAIRSIGACVFDPTATGLAWSTVGRDPVVNGPGSITFYQNVSLESCKKMKLHVDPDTAKWWSEQGEAAQAVLERDQIHLKVACLNFNTWFRSLGEDTKVWSHGAAFDIPIYAACCYAVHFKAPWSYRGVRDTRTLFDLAGFKTEDLPFVGTKHNALDDAINQARCVQMAMQRLKSFKQKAEAYDEFSVEQRS